MSEDRSTQEITDSFLKYLGIEKSPPLDPTSMTDEELAQLRFSFLNEENSEKVSKEIDKRLAKMKD